MRPRFASSMLVAGMIAMVMAVSAPGVTTAGEQLPEPTETDSLGDVDSYAQELGKNPAQAEGRLGLQAAAGDLDANLTSKAGDVFAGLWIEHEPHFHVIVLLTDPSRDISAYVGSTGLTGLVEVRGAAYSLKDLEADAAAILQSAGPGTRPFDLNIDVFGNEIIIETTSQSAFDAFLDDRDVELPETARIEVVGKLAEPSANIFGGMGLSSCTSGFSIEKNSTGTQGIVTAAHCADSQSYSGTSLPFQAPETFSGSNDEQWHTTPGFTVKNWATDGVNDSTPY